MIKKEKQKVNITENCKGMKHMKIDIYFLEIPMPLDINIGILQNVQEMNEYKV